MSRYPNPYAQHCEPNGSCGCCSTEADLDESAFSMPEDMTPEEGLLWEIFGRQPTESEND